MVASVSEDSNSYGILIVKNEFDTSTWLEALSDRQLIYSPIETQRKH